MHLHPNFAQPDRAQNLQLAQDVGFGTLALNAARGPLLSHLPFHLEGDVVELHLTRPNPILRELTDPAPAVLSVLGPNGYISPDWYGIADQVPTWNYIAVHLRGRLEKAEPEALPGMLDRLSAEFEARIADKPQWTRGKMPQDLQNRMFRQMMPCRLHIEEVTGIWKLNQNKPDEVRLRAADHVQDGALADVMRAASVPPKE